MTYQGRWKLKAVDALNYSYMFIPRLHEIILPDNEVIALSSLLLILYAKLQRCRETIIVCKFTAGSWRDNTSSVFL